MPPANPDRPTSRHASRRLLALGIVLGGVAGCGPGGAQPTTTAGSGADLCEPSPARCAGRGKQRPGRLSEHSAVYVPERGELVVFGGTGSVPDGCDFGAATQFSGETWIFDDACGTWERVDAEGPTPSGRHMAAYGDGMMWIFGGRFRDAELDSGDYELYPDLIRFDVAKRRWLGTPVEGERPAARVNGALVWDTQREKLWLFGGNRSTSGAVYSTLDDLWSFDPGTMRWQQERPANGGPAPRLFQAALYDAKRDWLVVYGGADENGFLPDAGYFDDLWALDLESLIWTPLSSGGAGTPEGRFWAGLVHDTELDAYVLFGGHDDQMLGNRNDTWLFDPEAERFRRLEGGAAFQRAANGTCDFPADFTTVDPGLPERRNAHGMVYAEGCGHTLVFGGKTDCGSIDDVWRFDGASWSEALEATRGEVCLRGRNPERCSSLCL